MYRHICEKLNDFAPSNSSAGYPRSLNSWLKTLNINFVSGEIFVSFPLRKIHLENVNNLLTTLNLNLSKHIIIALYIQESITPWIKHFNVICWNSACRCFERFAPEVSSSSVDLFKVDYSWMDEQLQNFFSRFAVLYRPPKFFGIFEGPQRNDDYCVVYCFMFAHVRMIQDDHPYLRLVEDMVQITQSNPIIVRKYLSWIESATESITWKLCPSILKLVYEMVTSY